MTVKRKGKSNIIEKFEKHPGDTGSAEVQIALLTDRINHLIEHLKINKKDHHGRRGLLIQVGRRKRLLSYLERTDSKKYISLVGSLGIR